MATTAATLPASTVVGLTVGENDLVSQADQENFAVTISGTLSAALPAGDTVEVELPSGVLRKATVASGGTVFSLILSATDTIAFSIPGQVSAFVVDPAGNQSTPFTQTFVAAAAQPLLPVTSTPSNFAGSGVSSLALSGDGNSVAFVASQTVGNTVQFDLYDQRLDTGTLTLVASGGSAPSLSSDGNLVAYEASHQVVVEDLTSGIVTQLSDPAGDTSGASGTDPGIADDGTVVFESTGDTALNGNIYQQVFVAAVSGGVATRTLISAAAEGTPGNGTSEYATISADGSTVVFLSKATNLLGAADPHAAALTGSYQIYAYALHDNPVTGQRAGTTVLVSGNPDGTVSDGTDYNPVVSGDGRYVLFQSVDLSSQVQLTDRLTGLTRIVSTSASGTAANAGVLDATLSADGNTVVFQSAANNLLAPGAAAPALTSSPQIYAKNLATGQVNLLSEGGYNPGDAISQDPTVSADGSVAAFASSADNLAPGVLGAANRTPLSRGYATAIAGSAALAIVTPPATVATTTLILTGTIDEGHATSPITVNDAADPGFLTVTATVTAGSEPSIDTWTATVIFTQTGQQTITVTAGDTAVQASVTLLNPPSLTIDPVNGTGVVSTTGQPGHVTTVTGTNPAATGDTVSLFLRTGASTLLPLGTAVTGADGLWSISVPDSAFGGQSSASDALVAETTDAGGNTIRAARAIALTIAAPTLLYAYSFTYTDGSFYTGTVADDGTYGYAAGQTITTGGGRYVVGVTAGTTTEPAGIVTVGSYFDVSTSASYTPTAAGGADGAAGLGSEADSITGPAGLLSFGGGVTEARQSAATAYSFAYVYNDGSRYFGSVVGGATTVYQPGQVLSDSNGYYQITGSQGAATAAIGTVTTSLYYDASSAASYVPVLYSAGAASGVQGLGSEQDSLALPSGTTNFGLAGVDKAQPRLVLTYGFRFFYDDGSYYYGYVIDDGTYKYSAEEYLKIGIGTYEVFDVSATSVSLGGVALTPGEVTVYDYYDSSTNVAYVPDGYAAGKVAGGQGLGSEFDFTTGDSGQLPFGGGALEAKQAPDQLFGFTFTYEDGSYYGGHVVDDGSYKYFVGQTITTAYGHYYISSKSPLAAGEGGLVSGQVYTTAYFDVTSIATYQTRNAKADLPSGTAGLGSEYDSIPDQTGVYRPFGFGGQLEARLAPDTLLDFIFRYTDGSDYAGAISTDGVTGPQLGQIITTPFGYFDITGYAGQTAAPPGTVIFSAYYDVTDNTGYTPQATNGVSNIGQNGLSSAEGYLAGPLYFGVGGDLEAKHTPNTLWNYFFEYPDTSQYSGQVVGNDESGLAPGVIQTPYGFFCILDSGGKTSLPVNSVTVDQYYDITTHKAYVPSVLGAGGIAGGEGLGSEQAFTTDTYTAEFGFGGKYEAKQSVVTTYSFTFRYADGTFYSGTYATGSTNQVGLTITETGGNYYTNGIVETQSSLPPGTVQVSSYFSTATGQFYTPVHYAAGENAGTGGLGSEIDYIAAGSGLRSFGGPTHIEADTKLNDSLLLTSVQFAFDGPIRDATVGYLDPKAPPGTLSIDPAQPTATTNADGSYQLAGGTGLLVLTGGTDTATRLPFKGVLESAGSGAVLSPVTTLIEAVAIARGDTALPGITAADALVAAAFALPAGLDLTSYMPGQILGDPASSPDAMSAAESVYRAGAFLLDAEALIDAAGGASRSAIGSVAEALAGGSLTDLTGLYPLIEDGGLAPAAETAIKAIVTATDAALDRQLASVTIPSAILGYISGAGIALQGNAAQALAATNADDAAVATSYVQTLSQTLPQADRLAFTASTACYGRGTSILTARGGVKVEALRIGDRVVTASGARRPIRWIGHRRVDCARHPDPAQVRPVRVRAGAFAANMPCRDLVLSPDHAVFADSVLIPIKHLINGHSIAQVTDEQVEYWHVELDSHDVLLAEGLPAESYLDTGNRAAFAIGADHVQLHPAFAARSWDDACAELVQDGPRLIAVKQRLFARAAIAAVPPMLGLEVIAGQHPLTPSAVLPGVWRYAVPDGERSLRLVSPPWMPAAYVDASLDRRQLGVRLLGVSIGEEDIPLEAPRFFSGFHPAETTAEGTCRWTDGDARLVLPPYAAMVTLQVGDEARVRHAA